MVDFPVELVLPDASKVIIDSEAEFNETIKTYRNDKEALSITGNLIFLKIIVLR